MPRICAPLFVALVAAFATPSSGQVAEPSVEDHARRLVETSNHRQFAVAVLLPEFLRWVEEKKETAIDSEGRDLIERWFSGEHLDRLLVPLYLRHMTPETIAAAADFYASERGASHARKMLAIWEGAPIEPTGDRSREAEALARELMQLELLDYGVGEGDLDLEQIVRVRYPDLSVEERAAIVAEWRRQGVVEATSRHVARHLTVEELRAALTFYRSPSGVAFRQGMAAVRSDLAANVAHRVEGLLQPGMTLSPLAMEQYWPMRDYTEVMGFLGRPSLIVPRDGTAQLVYAIDEPRGRELMERGRVAVVEPESFAAFDPQAEATWLTLDAEFRERFPDLDDIPSAGDMWLARFDLDENDRVVRATLERDHGRAYRSLAVMHRLLLLYRQKLESEH